MADSNSIRREFGNAAPEIPGQNPVHASTRIGHLFGDGAQGAVPDDDHLRGSPVAGGLPAARRIVLERQQRGSLQVIQLLVIDGPEECCDRAREQQQR